MNVQWRKSSYSGGVDDHQCVELGRLTPGTRIAMRDSKNLDGGHVTLTAAEFADLIQQIKQHPAR